MKPVRLSPTAVSDYETCPRKYRYRYIDRIKSENGPANLAFGSALHTAHENTVMHHFHGTSFDPVAAFEADFKERIESLDNVAYSAHMDFDVMNRIGVKLSEDFFNLWPNTGYAPLVDTRGEPLLEKKLTYEIAPGVLIVGKIDLPMLDEKGKVTVLDHKSARTPMDPDLALVSDQLTSYQILVDAHKDDWGCDQVEGLGFWENIKAKTKTRIEAPVIAPRRSPEEVEEFIQKMLWVAEDIRRGRFPKRPMMAYNSPCGMCDFADLCRKGDSTGLIFPPQFGVVAEPELNLDLSIEGGQEVQAGISDNDEVWFDFSQA